MEPHENCKRSATADLDRHVSGVGYLHFSKGDFKAQSYNGNLTRSIQAHSIIGDLRRSSSAKAEVFHGDVKRPIIIRLPWQGLFLKPKICISCSVVLFLVFGCLVYLFIGVYLVRPNDVLSFPLLRFLQRRHLNQTLLAHAKVDLGESLEQPQIEKILDGTWHHAAQSRYPSLHGRLGHEDHYRDRFYERRMSTRRTKDQRLPMQLSSPRYAPYWSLFRTLLHLWVQKKQYDTGIMKELLSLVKEPIDKHYLTKPNGTVEPGKPYKTCAVVGNSGILLNQSHAAFIDSHDMVMRLNNAQISGYERYVGSKTTISFVNSNILHTCARRAGCYCHPYGPDVPLIMYICQVVHFMDVAMCGSSHQAPIVVTDPRFDILCTRIVKYYSLQRFVETTERRLEDWSGTHEGPLFHYSSGMQAVLVAVGICERVSIFGFGKSGTSKHHYHTNQRSELRLHDYGAEYEFYMDLSTRDPQLIPFLSEAGFSLPSVRIYW